MFRGNFQHTTGLILCYLGVLHIALGIHSLHPALHEHESHSRPVVAYFGCDQEASHTGLGEFHPENAPCVICDFLATQQLQQAPHQKLSTPSFFEVPQAIQYFIRAMGESESVHHIRGPPSYLVI